MPCDDVIAALPWYWNRTLGEEEREAVERHLEACASCRAELAATAEVGRLHGAHPPVEDLLALAFGQEPAGGDTLARHLAHCAECREELALATASALAGEEESAPVVEMPRSRPRPIVRWAAAATIAAMILGAAVVLFDHQRDESLRWAEERQRMERRIEALTAQRAAESARAEAAEEALATGRPIVRGEEDPEADRIAALERELRLLGAPRAGHPVVELVPDELRLRADRAGGAAAVSPDGSPWVTLLLTGAPVAPDESYRIELRSGGETVWRSEATRPDRYGAFSLLLPAHRLDATDLSLVVLPGSDGAGEQPLATYRLRRVGA